MSTGMRCTRANAQQHCWSTQGAVSEAARASAVGPDLVHGWQHALQTGAVKQVLELGHNAVQQHVRLRVHDVLCSCHGVSSCQAVTLKFHQVPHSRNQLVRRLQAAQSLRL